MITLAEARAAKGLSLQQLADKVGSSKNYIWQLEQKESPQPTVKLAWNLHLALDVPVPELFDVELSNG